MCQIVEMIFRQQPNYKRKWRVGVVAVILILILIAIVVAAVIIVLRRSTARVRTSTSSSTAWRRPAVAIVVVVVVVASLRRCRRRRRRHPDKVLTLIPCFAKKNTISRIVLMTFRTPPSPLSNVEPCGCERISQHGWYFFTLGLFHSLFGRLNIG